MPAPDPYVAFLSSLQDAYAASLGSNAFTPGVQGIPGVPGAQAEGEGGPGGTVSALGSAGLGGGSVPGTATTGQSVLQGLLAGESTPAGESLLSRLSESSDIDSDPFQRSAPGVPNKELILAMLSGNPLGMLLAIGQAVSGQGATPEGFGIDAEGGTPFNFSSEVNERDSVLSNLAGVNTAPNVLTNPAGGVSFGDGLSFGGSRSSADVRDQDRRSNSAQFDSPEFGA